MSNDNKEMNALAASIANAINNGSSSTDTPVVGTTSDAPKAKMDMTSNLWMNMFVNGGTYKVPSSFMLWSNNRRQQAWIDLLTSEGYWGKDPLGVVFFREYGKAAVRFTMDNAEDVDIDGNVIKYTAKQKALIESAVNGAYDAITADNIAPSLREQASQRDYGEPIGVLVMFMYDVVDGEISLVQVPGVQKLRSKIEKDRRTVALWTGRETSGLKVQIKPRWNDLTGEKNADINIGYQTPAKLLVAD